MGAGRERCQVSRAPRCVIQPVGWSWAARFSQSRGGTAMALASSCRCAAPRRSPDCIVIATRARREEIGLDAVDRVSGTEARKRADRWRAILVDGRDPLRVRAEEADAAAESRREGQELPATLRRFRRHAGRGVAERQVPRSVARSGFRSVCVVAGGGEVACALGRGANADGISSVS